MICDEYGTIKDIDEEFATLLEYTPTELHGTFMGILMSPFLSFFHEKYLLPMYRHMNPEQKVTSHAFLESNSMSSKPLILYTKSGLPRCIRMSIHYLYQNAFFMKLREVIPMDCNMIYTGDCKPPELTTFQESKMDMVIICIDMKGSTQYLVDHGSADMIRIHKLFHQSIVYLIKTQYYPYLYLHEIMGDGFVLIMNIEWGFHNERFCASMTYCFLRELYNIMKPHLSFRTGVSYGKLHYGYIDKRLRFFGKPINLASRYESCSADDSFTTDQTFYDKLYAEGMIDEVHYTTDSIPLKGFGPCNVFHIVYNSNAASSTRHFAYAASQLSISGTPVLERRSIQELSPMLLPEVRSNVSSSHHSPKDTVCIINTICIEDSMTIQPYQSQQTKTICTMTTEDL